MAKASIPKSAKKPSKSATSSSVVLKSMRSQYSIVPENSSWVVKENSGSYDHWSSVIENITGKSAKKDFSLLTLRSLVLHGLPRNAFERVRDAAGISSQTLSLITGLPSRTLARRSKLLKPDESERLLRVASVVQKGMEVLEDKDRLQRWLSSPKRALGGLTPLECCDTMAGAQATEDLLERIADGVFS